jgi:hypothetical protein
VYPEGSFGYWTENWAWGIPLVGLSVVFHVIGLSATAWLVRRTLGHYLDPTASASFYVVFALVTGVTTMLLAVLHGLEAALWGAVYAIVGAVPNYPTGVVHSLTMMTTTGSDVSVDPHWRLLGGIQAIAGWLLFGLSTAFLFSVMDRIRPLLPAPGRRG